MYGIYSSICFEEGLLCQDVWMQMISVCVMYCNNLNIIFM